VGLVQGPRLLAGITDYMQKDCQTVFRPPSWATQNLGGLSASWYQRKFTVPPDWTNRRVVVCAEYLNSFAAVYVDGQRRAKSVFLAASLT